MRDEYEPLPQDQSGRTNNEVHPRQWQVLGCLMTGVSALPNTTLEKCINYINTSGGSIFIFRRRNVTSLNPSKNANTHPEKFGYTQRNTKSISS